MFVWFVQVDYVDNSRCQVRALTFVGAIDFFKEPSLICFAKPPPPKYNSLVLFHRVLFQLVLKLIPRIDYTKPRGQARSAIVSIDTGFFKVSRDTFHFP